MRSFLLFVPASAWAGARAATPPQRDVLALGGEGWTADISTSFIQGSCPLQKAIPGVHQRPVPSGLVGALDRSYAFPRPPMCRTMDYLSENSSSNSFTVLSV